MLLRYKRNIILFIVLLLFPISVLADTTYTTDLEDGFEYGNVTSCYLNVGMGYYTIAKVNNIMVCVTTDSSAIILDNGIEDGLTCDDSEMVPFRLDNINGSNGNNVQKYYGYGCRKSQGEVQNPGNPDDNNNQDCNSLLGGTGDDNSPAHYLMIAFTIIKYISIILLIVLSMFDMIGAVASHDDDAIKKSTRKIIIRVVLCIVIFLFPSVLRYILDLINDAEVGECLNEIARN